MNEFLIQLLIESSIREGRTILVPWTRQLAADLREAANGENMTDIGYEYYGVDWCIHLVYEPKEAS